MFNYFINNSMAVIKKTIQDITALDPSVNPITGGDKFIVFQGPSSYSASMDNLNTFVGNTSGTLQGEVKLFDDASSVHTGTLKIGTSLLTLSGDTDTTIAAKEIVSLSSSFINIGIDNKLNANSNLIDSSVIGFKNTICIGSNDSGDVPSARSNIAGGCMNKIVGSFSTIGGGKQNYLTTNSSNIGGGRGNTIVGQYGTEISTSNNPVYSTIGGGFGNVVQNAATGSTIAGGCCNQIECHASNVGGGFCNRIIGTSSGAGIVGFSTIAGGKNNTVNNGSNYAIIGGGLYNSTRNNYSTVLGGYSNQACGEFNCCRRIY